MTPDELSKRLARCQRALDASHDGYWERNLRDQRIWYSPSFLAMFGFVDGDLPTARGAATARVHPDDQPRFRAAYAEALRVCGRFDYEVRFLDAHGQWRWIRGRGQVVPDAQGRPEFLCGAVADVHHRTSALLDLEQHRRSLEALVRERTAGLEAALTLAEQRRQEAERANAAKSRFLAQMSHEIRTPLNGLLGLTELALRAAEHPVQRRHLEAAGQSGRALLQVISDVLDFSRIESGRVELQPRPFDPTLLLTETYRAVMPLARERRLLMLFDWLGDEGPLLGDEALLRQVFTNLLGNAIKFTPEGQVSLVAEATPAAEGRRRLVVCVRDTGPGVPEAHRARVFEAFEQADDRLSRHHGGTGLGLTIALRLVQAMGGQLQLDCPAEGGSVFTVTLDLPVAEARPAAAAPGRPGRAWVVYHRADAGRWMAMRLARLGWQVDTLVGLDATLARARDPAADRPDLVLLGEPALTPHTDLAPLRDALPAARMHLLIRPDWHEPALEAQADTLNILPLVAPLTPAMLRDMALADDAAAAAPAPPGPAPWASAGPPLPATAEVLLVEDNPVNQLVGQAFLQALGVQVRLAADGHEALAACAEHAPALVLMDLQMPGMDGLEATRALMAMQRAGQWRGAPILALTAHATEADRQACQDAGMAAVLTKPLSLEVLRHQLQRWLPARP